MVCPSRKNRMIQTIIQNQDRDKEKLKGEKVKQKEISQEEHNKRVEILKKIGLIKKN